MSNFGHICLVTKFSLTWSKTLVSTALLAHIIVIGHRHRHGEVVEAKAYSTAWPLGSST